MKVCIITPIYYPHGNGGQENFTLELVQRLQGRGHTVSVITTGEKNARIADDGRGEIHQIKSIAFRPFLELSQRRLGWAAKHLNEMFSSYGARRTRELIGGNKPDVLFSQGFYGFGRGMPQTLAGLGIPWLHFVHSYDLVCKRQTATDDKRCACARQCSKCAVICRFKYGMNPLRRAVTIYNSDHMRRFCEDAGMAPHESHVIDPVFGMDAPEVCATYSPVAPIRLLYVGRVSPEKGIQVLCEGVAAGAGKYHLDVLGSGALLDELRTRHANAPITFHGLVGPARRDALLREGHALVAPSLWNEPFGRVVHEGFLGGLPVIVPNVGGMGGLVRHGVDGFVFGWRKGAEVESLSEALAESTPMLGRLRGGALETRARIMQQDNFGLIERLLLRACEGESVTPAVGGAVR